MWKGSIGFGMVNIPVKLYKTTDTSSSVSLCNTHNLCGTAVTEPKYCPRCEQFLKPTDLQKAFPMDSKKETCIPLSAEEIASIPIQSAHVLQIEGFITEIPDIRYYDSFYVIAPEETGHRAFALLETALRDTGLIGIGKITTGSKEHLAAIQPTGDGLITIITLRWTADLRDISELPRPNVEVSEKERDMAKMLIDTLPKALDLSTYTNEYGNALKKLIEAKNMGEEIPAFEAPVTKEVDLVEALMASLKAAEGAPAK